MGCFNSFLIKKQYLDKTYHCSFQGTVEEYHVRLQDKRGNIFTITHGNRPSKTGFVAVAKSYLSITLVILGFVDEEVE